MNNIPIFLRRGTGCIQHVHSNRQISDPPTFYTSTICKASFQDEHIRISSVFYPIKSIPDTGGIRQGAFTCTAEMMDVICTTKLLFLFQ